MENKVSNFVQKIEQLQNALIAINDNEIIQGDGETLVSSVEFPIAHDFSDQLYMRKMEMKADSIVVSAIHHTDHFWFLLKGKILVATDGETIEYSAPYIEKSIKGAKRVIACLEDCIFVNVHKNPSNTKDMKEIENNLYSFTIEDYIKKEK